MSDVNAEDLVGASAFLKQWYENPQVTMSALTRHPLLAMIDEGETGGEVHPHTIYYGGSQGGAAAYGGASRNRSNDSAAKFMVTVADDYQLATTQWKVKKASQNSKGAFLNVLQTRIERMRVEMMSRIASRLHRTKTGTIGQISTIDANGNIALVDAADGRLFPVKGAFRATATDGGALRAGTGYVLRSDMLKGKFQVSATVGGAGGTPGGWVVGDYLVRDGDRDSDAVIAMGWQDWIPAFDKQPIPGELFLGVDRSVSPVDLCGLSLDGRSMGTKQALMSALAMLSAFEEAPDYAFMGTKAWTDLANTMEGTRIRVDVERGGATIGFNGFQIDGPSGTGTCTVVHDPDTQSGHCLVTDISTWKRRSYGGKSPVLEDYDSGQVLRILPDASAVEARWEAYYNLFCDRPRASCHLTLPK